MREVEVPNWVKGLPLAPEYRPTDTEFADPIAYISKIEKEASAFGICKIIPPLPKPSKKYVISNLTKSLANRPELGPALQHPDACSPSTAVFTTRQQELGNNGKKKVVRKQVWQSGEVYTLEQFESKAKAFARAQLGDIKTVSPLVIETLFWEAASEKPPIYVEYANDVPGSGFSPPVGPCRYLNNRRRRRKTSFRRNCGGSCAIMKSPQQEVVQLASLDQELKHSDPSDEMEGSAGWKLSNSPWNLQVIARSLGSLTRFMADDIPGVTSPMVYIGMLFSWFAWHVEDHELHSMNFLHTGSPKTWYAVPGDHVFSFEEVVCSQAYGVGVDRLAALTRLGEKTTLLSPEVIVDSGIPCCRLVQNPGEFIVTFPRAYHVGFSHGFNCGEAANFGTPKWLEVAKEAAVRRAAMNYLPMLSHQQLLYLLTMSFVSRIPRSLLPGARNSRLRDRLKDERELSVKKAFLDDISSENKLLTTVLRRSGSNRVVLWNLESLPSFAKKPELYSPSNTIAEDNASSENKNNQDLLREMNLFMENVNDLYMDIDDLSGDFQLYSGSLACVACGVLGFPFMSVVQPSERASANLMQDVGMSKHDCSHSIPVANGTADSVSVGVRVNLERCGSNSLHHSNGESCSRDPVEVPKVSLESQIEKGWCSTKGFLRPRIFCLEHAVHINDLLRSKGGANVLVICHSDFKKMEVHAAVIKEQVTSPFRYKEVPLDNATQDDLKLVDLAIDDEEHDECGNDWTSKLRINLRHSVKMRKSSLCKSDQHALALGRLFSDADSSHNTFDLKWPLTKSRSKTLKKSREHINTRDPGLGNLTESMDRETSQLLVGKSDADITRIEPKIIQYSRRTSKCKPGEAIIKTFLRKQVHNEASVADCVDPNKHSSQDRFLKDLVTNTGCAVKESSGLGISASNGHCESQFGTVVSVSSQAACSVAPGDQKADDSAADVFEMQHETEVDKGTKKIVTLSAENSACSIVVAVEDYQHSVIDGQNKSAVNVSVADMKEAYNLVDFAPSCCSDTITAISEARREEGEEVEKYCEDVEVVDCTEEQDIQGTNGDKEPGPYNDTLTDQSSVIPKIVSVEVSMTKDVEEMHIDGHHSSPGHGGLENAALAMVCRKSNPKDRKKRRELDLHVDNQYDFDGFTRSPCEGLRPRSSKLAKVGELDTNKEIKEKPTSKKSIRPLNSSVSCKDKKQKEKVTYRCDLENCRMRFHTMEALRMHKRNRCPVKGCGKRFSSHKNAVVHQRVHEDDRPLKCPWKGCDKSFKWGWARTEHMRLHTGERPYSCKVEGCSLTFRFIADYSRHRRKTGHYVTPPT